MSDCMHFPDTVEEFMEQYKMTDTEQVYSNGIEYVPIFRMKQWFEYEKAQLFSEDATSDTISRTEVVEHLRRMLEATVPNTDYDEGFVDGVEFGVSTVSTMPTIQPEQCGDKSYTLWKESYEELKRRMDELTSCSDIISRQAAIDALDCLATEVDENGDELFLKDEAYHVIEVLPTIQPEPHDGRFERKQDGVFCSVCHYGWEFITGVPAEVEREYHYCPNCGARMKGESNETDRVD